MNKRIGITCLIILVSACLIIGTLAAVGVGVYAWDRNNPRATITSAPTVAPIATNCPEDSCTVPKPGGAVPPVELPKDISRIMDAVQEEVIEIRGLQPVTDIPRALLTPDQLRQNVINDFLAEYTPKDAEKDAITLSLFGLLPENFDLLTFYENLYNEQIAGYYDDEAKEMYVISGGVFGGPEKMTYAHEFTHILQDQNYDFENGLKMSEEDCEEDSERCAAASALIEGDASLTEYRWFYKYATSQDQADVQSFYENFQSPVYDSSPDFMKEDFLFSYSAGQEFVQVLYDQGGWPAVNNAYTDPPLSTEQIMHPDRYPDDTPIKIHLPDLSSILGEGWQQIESDVVGEWYTYLMLAKGYRPDTQLDDETAREATEGWGGDTYQIYDNSTKHQTVLIIKAVWDTDQDAKNFYDVFRLYGKARWGSPSSRLTLHDWFMNLLHGVKMPSSVTTWKTDAQSVEIRYDSFTTIVIIAPDADTRNLLIQSIVEK